MDTNELIDQSSQMGSSFGVDNETEPSFFNDSNLNQSDQLACQEQFASFDFGTSTFGRRNQDFIDQEQQIAEKEFVFIQEEEMLLDCSSDGNLSKQLVANSWMEEKSSRLLPMANNGRDSSVFAKSGYFAARSEPMGTSSLFDSANKQHTSSSATRAFFGVPIASPGGPLPLQESRPKKTTTNTPASPNIEDSSSNNGLPFSPVRVPVPVVKTPCSGNGKLFATASWPPELPTSANGGGRETVDVQYKAQVFASNELCDLSDLSEIAKVTPFEVKFQNHTGQPVVVQFRFRMVSWSPDGAPLVDQQNLKKSLGDERQQPPCCVWFGSPSPRVTLDPKIESRYRFLWVPQVGGHQGRFRLAALVNITDADPQLLKQIGGEAEQKENGENASLKSLSLPFDVVV